MLTSTEIIILAKQICQEFCLGRPDHHGFVHHVIVAGNVGIALGYFRALCIQLIPGESNEYSETVAMVAALIHDIVDEKFALPRLATAKFTVDEMMMQLIGRMRNNKFPENLIADSTKIISNISWSKENKGLNENLGRLELVKRIVAQSDYLEALGNAGLERCHEYNKEIYHGKDEAFIKEKMIEHCNVKLLRIYSEWFIDIAPLREIAKTRHNEIKQWCAAAIA